VRRFLRLAVALALVGAWPGIASAQEWLEFATISMTNVTTPKLVSGAVCYNDGLDLVCDSAAGLLSTSGTLTISNVSASNVVSSMHAYARVASFTTLYVGGQAVTGGGSGTAGDRISTTGVASGVNLAMVMTSTGTVSFTTGGTAGTAYFDTSGRLVLPGISATTNQTSVTSLYASGYIQLEGAAGGAGAGSSGISENDPQVGTMTASKWCVANGAGTAIDCTNNEPVSGGTPGGNTTEVQFNNSGSFAGSSGLTWNGTTLAASNLSTGGALSVTGAATLGSVGTGNIAASGYVSASTVSATGIGLGGKAAPCTQADDAGKLFKHPTTGRYGICRLRS
jgi:hypothetical protein